MDNDYAHHLERLAASCIDTLQRLFKDRIKLQPKDPKSTSENDNLENAIEEIEGYSTPRKRWITAIDKIINENFLNKIKLKISESPFLTSLAKLKPKYHFQAFLDVNSPPKPINKNDHMRFADDKRKSKGADDNHVVENTHNNFLSMSNLLGRNANKSKVSKGHHEEKHIPHKESSKGLFGKIVEITAQPNENKISDDNTSALALSSSLPSLSGKMKNLIDPSTRHLGDTKSSLVYKEAAVPRRNKSINSYSSNTTLLPPANKKSTFLNDPMISVNDLEEVDDQLNDKEQMVHSKKYEKHSPPFINEQNNDNKFVCEVSSYHYGEVIKSSVKADKWEWYNQHIPESIIPLPDGKSKTTILAPLESKPSVATASIDHNNHINGLKVNERLMKLGTLKLQSLEDTNTSDITNLDEKLKSPRRPTRHTIDNSNIISPKSAKSVFNEDDSRLESINEIKPFNDMTILSNGYHPTSLKTSNNLWSLFHL